MSVFDGYAQREDQGRNGVQTSSEPTYSPPDQPAIIMTTSPRAPLATETTDTKGSAAERRYGGLSADERNRQRRQKFVDASIQVFGTLGLRKATIRDICNEARIAERYFSEQFSSAADAYEAVFKLLSEQALVTTGMAIASAPMNTHDMSVAGLTAFMTFVKEDPRRAQILLIDASSYWRNVTIRTNPELNKHAFAMKRFSDVLYPDLPDHIRLEIIGSALIGSTLQACLNWVQSGSKQSVESVVKHLMFVWDGMDQWFRAEIAASKQAAAAAQQAAMPAQAPAPLAGTGKKATTKDTAAAKPPAAKKTPAKPATKKAAPASEKAAAKKAPATKKAIGTKAGKKA